MVFGMNLRILEFSDLYSDWSPLGHAPAKDAGVGGGRQGLGVGGGVYLLKAAMASRMVTTMDTQDTHRAFLRLSVVVASDCSQRPFSAAGSTGMALLLLLLLLLLTTTATATGLGGRGSVVVVVVVVAGGGGGAGVGGQQQQPSRRGGCGCAQKSVRRPPGALSARNQPAHPRMRRAPPYAASSSTTSTSTTSCVSGSGCAGSVVVMSAHPRGPSSKWLFSREQLDATPSRRCGVESDRELSYRQQAANLIQDMGQRLNVYPLPAPR
ncbi:hypothetical protein CRUP_033683 [Coryphaenoides rupestris]|nr:hypothetical protein CRUP_033683 [Coryphaenoides rupestris]